MQVTGKIAHGETLMVTGFTDRGAVSDRQGSIDADVPVPFDGRSAHLVREERVLLIAAEVGAPLGITQVHGVEPDGGESLPRGDYP